VTPSGGLSDEEINSIIEDAKKHSEEDRRRAELIRVRTRLEGLVESNQKTFSEFGSMLGEDKQLEVRRILDNAKKALDVGSMAECTEALEKIAEVGQILSEVILYDPSTITAGAEETEADTVEEA
jgi:molecular chaperone DnaK